MSLHVLLPHLRMCSSNLFPHLPTLWLNLLDLKYLRQDYILQKSFPRTSLVAQWLRIRLPMQGTQVRALVREDPTCRGATKPVVPQLLKPARLEPVLRNKRSHHNEKPPLATTRESPHASTKTQRSPK